MSIKLLRPVQYESVIGSLNKARPLFLADEGRVILSIPVLNAEPVSNEKTVRGKFLRCHGGSVLISDSDTYSQHQLKFKFVGGGQLDITEFTFDPPVDYVTVNVMEIAAGKELYWIVPVINTVIETYPDIGTYPMRFRGSKITMMVPAAGPGPVEYELYGFYGKGF